jgi:streptogramin lyase
MFPANDYVWVKLHDTSAFFGRMRKKSAKPGRPLRRLNFLTLLGILLAALGPGCGKQPPMATAAVAPPPPLEYAGAWGMRGTGPGQLNAPVGMAADAAGNVYIADAGNACVSKFSALGEPRLSFQDDRLNLHPVSIAVDGGGAIYLGDGVRGSVIIYRPDGSRLREMRLGVQGEISGTLRVAVDAEGHICVAGKKPFGLRKYTWRGRPVSPWKNSAATGAASGEPAGLAAGPDGLLYVSDAARSVIRVYQRDGTLLRMLTAPGGGVPFAGIAVNAQWIVATDPRGHALHVWTSGGAYRLRADLSPWITATDPSPQAVALTPGGECLVLDAPGARVLRFRLHL